MSRAEIQAGVEPVADAMETWLAAWAELATLKARYGYGGTFEHDRKSVLAAARRAARTRLAEAQRQNPRVALSEAAVDDFARQDRTYRKLLADAEHARDRMFTLEATVDAIRMTYDRHNLLLRLQRQEQAALPVRPPDADDLNRGEGS